MTIDPDLAAWLDRLQAAGIPSYPELGHIEARRMMDEGAAALFDRVDEIAHVEDTDADGVNVRIYEPAECGDGALVWFHGGGWVIGSLVSHDPLCRRLAARSGRRVVSVDYRLAPEHRHPAAVDDAWAATDWAVRRFGKVAAGGDSAGGHLTAVTTLRARDRGLPLALQVLVVPVTDYSFDTASYRTNGTGFGLTADTMRWFWEQYIPDASAAHDPEVSPLRAPSHAGLPRALVLTAGCDPLRDEGFAYAEKLARAGVDVTHHGFDDAIHGFFRMPAVTRRADDAISQVAEAVRVAL